jgi:hypothetical protein
VAPLPLCGVQVTLVYGINIMVGWTGRIVMSAQLSSVPIGSTFGTVSRKHNSPSASTCSVDGAEVPCFPMALFGFEFNSTELHAFYGDSTEHGSPQILMTYGGLDCENTHLISLENCKQSEAPSEHVSATTEGTFY